MSKPPSRTSNQPESSYNLRKQYDSKKKSEKTSKSVKMAPGKKNPKSAKVGVAVPCNVAAESRARTASDSDSTLDVSDASVTPLPTNSGSEKVLNSMAEMRDMISGKLDHVLGELMVIKGDLAQTKKAVSELETNVDFVSDKLAALEKEEIPMLKEKIKQQEEVIEEKLIMMEIHHRKQNLLVYGIPDRPNEDITTTVREILCYFLHIAPEEGRQFQLVNAHRLPSPRGNVKQLAGQPEPGPRPIIIRFSCMFDRDRLLRAFESQPRRQQKGAAAPTSPAKQGSEDPDPVYSRVTIRTDLPPKLKRERGRLAAEAYKQRRENKVSTRIRLVGAKIILQTRTFSPNGALNTTPWTTWSE